MGDLRGHPPARAGARAAAQTATHQNRIHPRLHGMARRAEESRLNRSATLRCPANLAAVRDGKIWRLIVNLPPRHQKSLLASIAFPAWCLGHEPSAQILCVSHAQELADKLSRDCRHIVAS